MRTPIKCNDPCAYCKGRSHLIKSRIKSDLSKNNCVFFWDVGGVQESDEYNRESRLQEN